MNEMEPKAEYSARYVISLAIVCLLAIPFEVLFGRRVWWIYGIALAGIFGWAFYQDWRKRKRATAASVPPAPPPRATSADR